MFNDQISIKVGAIYPISFTTSLSTQSNTTDNYSFELFLKWCTDNAMPNIPNNDNVDNKIITKQSKKQQKSCSILTLLGYKTSPFIYYGMDIISHCLLICNIPLNESVIVLLNEENNIRLVTLYNMFYPVATIPTQLLEQLDFVGHKGYVVYENNTISDDVVANADEVNSLNNNEKGDAVVAHRYQDKLFIEFVPFIGLKQYEQCQYLEFDSFSKAIDEYYYKIEDQKLSNNAIMVEANIKKKVEKVKSEQNQLINSLVAQQEKIQLSAQLVELCAEEIDGIVLVINSALESGMSWDDIEDMVEYESKVNKNPYAQLVKQLHLDKQSITLQLRNELYEDDDDDGVEDMGLEDVPVATPVHLSTDDSNSKESKKNKKEKTKSKLKQKDMEAVMPEIPLNKQKYILVDININKSANANASMLYTSKKQAHAKEEKTALNAVKAVEGVEKQVHKQLNQMKVKNHLQAIRKVHWFEKFNWFITTEGYLCISGRDAQQNELLVKRYMKPYDAYVHADIAGAASCVVKAKLSNTGDDSAQKDTVISPIALQEAAVNTICRSIAWSNKIIIGAWWVWGNQVSKTPPTGEYLTTGSFMIYGKKNFLSPASLELGFGVMFRLDDKSVMNHKAKDDLKSKRTENRGIVMNAIQMSTNVQLDLVSDEQVAVSTDTKKGMESAIAVTVPSKSNNSNKMSSEHKEVPKAKGKVKGEENMNDKEESQAQLLSSVKKLNQGGKLNKKKARK